MTQKNKTAWNRENWPIAAAMIQYPNVLPDGSSVQEQTAEQWAETLSDVTELGFTELDPTDSWLRIADLSPSRLDEFLSVTRAAGLSIPAISTARRSVIDPNHGADYLRYLHRVIDTAAAIGAKEIAVGLSAPLSDDQKKALWFWTAKGHVDSPDPAVWKLAVERIRDLGQHAGSVGVTISLEMYEDTYLGTADSSVRFVEDVNHSAVGLNADIGNLIRLHRPVEHWSEMMRKVAPFLRYWHVKNYIRDEDAVTGTVSTSPAPMEFGLINYRQAIKTALQHGFQSAFLVEHYGGDGLSVAARNRDYIRTLLPR
ncbi:hypothetical protein AA103196_2612 [Ameyamaea chiangmaiensis NBRC 103196]|uniref:Sugar phosphate isomerase/epimerase n=1 Tax=Ameyamaea chiangmaiensis TaxID=442969 RepID=A0A850P8I6_9PROT|nr:sugar phosphate isomerase/epimerase family protein [Ameyamaea chiangmaiensis]MBS4075587.1 sugar phosphate isomerase/epimerase [Ameyamaea chiangmaiensis]NVN40284.1 sugar phosphate isomerase/epimerase [Ameyamaea chiangmaiensis]GBQ70851.1 hypothetical protein AA103196_2612 [Ameyamaea chiangmaiensis NBRC 103196]